MEVKKENVMAAYKVATDSERKMIKALFHDLFVEDERPVTERIKTFEDACHAIGIDADTEKERYESMMTDEVAYQKLRIIVAALNEGWKPLFAEGEWRWTPWFCLLDEEDMENTEDYPNRIETGAYSTTYAGFAFTDSDRAPSHTSANIGSRLCFKSETLSDYCAKQFISLWADFTLIRK